MLSVLVARDLWRRGGDDCWRRFSSLLDDLEHRAPTSGFWLDDVPGAADVSLYGQLQSFRTALTPFQRDELGQRPRLSSYLDRMNAYRRALRSAA